MQRRRAAALIAAALVWGAPPVRAQISTVSPSLYQSLHWRFIGPLRGGRTVALDGIANEPNVFYIGAVNGGIWKTQDAGRTWTPVFDASRPARSARSPSRRAIRGSSTRAAARDCSVPISPSATASTNRSTPARPGRISGCATASRSRRWQSIRPMRIGSSSPCSDTRTAPTPNAACTARPTAARRSSACSS